MPVYIVHGFRWPRDGFSGVRVHTIVHNLEDCSAEYIQNAHSREDLLGSFRTAFPDVMKQIEVQGRSLEFIEPYDPDDISPAAVTQPYAYVADKVVELAGKSLTPGATSEKEKNIPKGNGQVLSVNVEEVIADGPGLTTQAWEAMADLRDKIAPSEKIGWWIVYNGDPERAYDDDEEDDSDAEYDAEEEGTVTPTAERSGSVTAPSATVSPPTQQTGPPVPPKPTAAEASPITNKPLPIRSKPGEVVKPEAVLPTPKNEPIPEPPKLKEVTKKSGFRSKFFGKKV